MSSQGMMVNETCFPPLCKSTTHTFKSKSSSSLRVLAPVVYFGMEDWRKKNHNQLSSKRRRHNRKHQKLRRECAFVFSDEIPNEKKVSSTDIKDNFVVTDGGAINNEPLKPSNKCLTKPLKLLQLRNDDLHVLRNHLPCTGNPDLGIYFSDRRTIDVGDIPSFILTPRPATINHTLTSKPPNPNKLCDAFDACEAVQCLDHNRGKNRPVFGTERGKYCCVGAQVSRNQRGVRECTYHFDKVEQKHSREIVKFAKYCESILEQYAPSIALRFLESTKALSNYKTISQRNGAVKKAAEYFSGCAFGKNVYLPVHTDLDYSYSIVTVHKRDQGYTLLDAPVIYFTFPRLGVAVPLRPGDVLIFNPKEPHAVSSRCHNEEEIYCVSLYLKSAVVGKNDNSLPLTPQENELVGEHQHSAKKIKV
jgi:hypothetical protein